MVRTPSRSALGVTVGSIANQMGAGSFQVTGSTLDVAIQGDGWIRVGNGTPTAATRRPVRRPVRRQLHAFGQLHDERQGLPDHDRRVLRDGQGQHGHGRDRRRRRLLHRDPEGRDRCRHRPGRRRELHPPAGGYTQPAALPPIGADGRAIAGYLSVSTFPTRLASSASRTTAGRPPPSPAPSRPVLRAASTGRRIAGVLEMSNVDMATEFTTMISAQRGFQANLSRDLDDRSDAPGPREPGPLARPHLTCARLACDPRGPAGRLLFHSHRTDAT